MGSWIYACMRLVRRRPARCPAHLHHGFMHVCVLSDGALLAVPPTCIMDSCMYASCPTAPCSLSRPPASWIYACMRLVRRRPARCPAHLHHGFMHVCVLSDGALLAVPPTCIMDLCMYVS